MLPTSVDRAHTRSPEAVSVSSRRHGRLRYYAARPCRSASSATSAIVNHHLEGCQAPGPTCGNPQMLRPTVMPFAPLATTSAAMLSAP